MPSLANEIAAKVSSDEEHAGSWKKRFGFEIVKAAIENIEFTEASRKLMNEFNANKMCVKAYDDVSQKTANIAAQQKIAEGIRENGLGDAAGMAFGMNMGQNLSSMTPTGGTVVL